MTQDEIKQEGIKAQQEKDKADKARLQRLQRLADDFFSRKKSASGFDGTYGFQMVLVPDAPKGISRKKIRIALPDDDYRKLLYLMMDYRELKIQDLFYKDTELFRTIDRECRREYYLHDLLSGKDEGRIPKPTAYVIIPEEPLKDVEEILGEPDANENLFSADADCQYINAYVSDGLLGVVYGKQTGTCCERRELTGIDARTVQRLLGCENQAALFAEMKNRFGCENGIDLIKTWLTEQGVAFDDEGDIELIPR